MIMIANLQYAWTLFVKPMQAQHRLEAVRHPVRVHAVHPVPDLGAAARRLADRSPGPARLHHRGRPAVRARLGGAGLRDVAADALRALLRWPASARRSSTAAAIGSALKWFKERRGLASGIMAAGFGGGTALFIPIISSMHRLDAATRPTFISTGIFQGLVIVIVAQFLRHPPREPAAAGAGRRRRPSQLGKRQFTTLEMLRTPQFYVMYATFVMMATGGLLVTANAGPMAQVVGILGRGADARGHAQPAGQRRQPHLLGLGVRSPRPRERRWSSRSLLQALCLVHRSSRSASSPAAWFTLTLVARVLHLGRDLLAVPVDCPATTSAPTRDVELRRAVHREGRGLDHRRLGRRAAVRAVPAAGRWASTAAP